MVVGHVHEIGGDCPVVMLGVTGLMGWTNADFGDGDAWAGSRGRGRCGFGSGSI
jgi:hypothetical protein